MEQNAHNATTTIAPIETLTDTFKRQRQGQYSTQLQTSPFVSLLQGATSVDTPIYLYEWVGNDVPLRLPYGFSPQQPPQVKTKKVDDISNNDEPTSLSIPSQLPIIHVDEIMAVHKEALPKDILPGQFLVDIVKQQLGKIVIACQFIPNTNKTDQSISHTDLDTTKQDQHLKKYDTKIVGCVAGLYMQFWSRKKDAEFALRRILNIFSIFVSPFISSVGIGKHLLDGMVYLWRPDIVNAHDVEESKVDNNNDINGVNNMNKVLFTPHIDEISLEVRATNHKAMKFYESKGFVTQNIEKNYYPQGLNAKDKTMHEMVVDFDQYKYIPNGVFNQGKV